MQRRTIAITGNTDLYGPSGQDTISTCDSSSPITFTNPYAGIDNERVIESIKEDIERNRAKAYWTDKVIIPRTSAHVQYITKQVRSKLKDKRLIKQSVRRGVDAIHNNKS